MGLSIRVKVTVSILAVLLVSLCALALGLSWEMRKRFSALERRDLDLNLGRLEEVISDRVGVPATKIIDWAYWDDAFKFVSERDAAFREANLVPNVLDTLKLDSLRIYDLEGNRVDGVDRILEGEKSLSTVVDAAIAKHPTILRDLSRTEPLKGFVEADGRILILAALPIRPSSGEGEPSGVLVFLKKMDDTFSEEVSKLSKFSVAFEHAGVAIPGAHERSSKAPGVGSLMSAVLDEKSVGVWARAVDLEGRPLGLFRTTLGRDVMLAGRSTLATLLLSTILISGVTLFMLLLVMNRFVIRRLVRLNDEIETIERSQDADARVTVSGRDEITNVSRALNQTLVTIADRNAALREIVQNVMSGFLMVTPEGKVLEGYTRHCESLLGTVSLTNRKLSELLFESDRERGHFECMLLQCFDDVFPDDVAVAQVPAQTQVAQRWLSLEPCIVRNVDGRIKSLLFTLTDITSLKNAEIENQEIQAVVKIIQSRSVFRSFIEELPTQLQDMATAIRTEYGQSATRKSLHTLKGNFGMFGMREVADAIHAIEDSSEITLFHLQEIESLVTSFLSRHESILGFRLGEQQTRNFTLTTRDLEDLLAESTQWGSIDEARRETRAFVERSKRVRADEVLAPLVEAAEQLALRFGKNVRVVTEGEDIRLDHERFRSVFDSLINAVRNSLDHGLESPWERGDKPESGTLWLGVAEDEGVLRLWVADDGRGVRFDRLRASVCGRGLCTPEEFDALTEERKLQFLFENNISTAENVSDISGRGLGMGAIRNAVRDVGGDVKLTTDLGKGTRISITLPAASSTRTRALRLAS